MIVFSIFNETYHILFHYNTYKKIHIQTRGSYVSAQYLRSDGTYRTFMAIV